MTGKMTSQTERAAPKVFCIGWSPVDVNNGIWNPQPPKSYVKQETRDEWTRNTLARAPLLPYVGRPADIVVLDDKGETVLDHASPAQFLEFANEHGKFQEMDPWAEAPAPSAIFASFNTKELFVSCAAVLWREGVRVPRRFWRNPPGIVEIYETLVPGALRDGFGTDSLLLFAGSDFADTELLQSVMRGSLQTAAERANVVWALASFAQLL